MDYKKIVDNVIPQYIADNIEAVLTSDNFPWFFMPSTVSPGDRSGQFLMHLFYDKHKVNSNFYEVVEPLIEIIKPRSLVRVKANLYPVSTKIIEHGFHVDYNWKDVNTAVYYVNDNDGYTKLSDNAKIESVKNRLATLGSLVSHTSSTSTTNVRITINFNWF